MPHNKRALSDDYFPDDFNERLVIDNNDHSNGLGQEIEVGDGMLDNEDDDDFREGDDVNNLMFLDNLGNPDAMGYDDQEEPEEEDDDVIRDDEIVMEED